MDIEQNLDDIDFDAIEAIIAERESSEESDFVFDDGIFCHEDIYVEMGAEFEDSYEHENNTNLVALLIKTIEKIEKIESRLTHMEQKIDAILVTLDL